MFKRVPSARTKDDKRFAADCSNVQPHYWQYSCYVLCYITNSRLKRDPKKGSDIGYCLIMESTVHLK